MASMVETRRKKRWWKGRESLRDKGREILDNGENCAGSGVWRARGG